MLFWFSENRNLVGFARIYPKGGGGSANTVHIWKFANFEHFTVVPPFAEVSCPDLRAPQFGVGFQHQENTFHTYTRYGQAQKKLRKPMSIPSKCVSANVKTHLAGTDATKNPAQTVSIPAKYVFTFAETHLLCMGAAKVPPQ